MREEVHGKVSSLVRSLYMLGILLVVSCFHLLLGLSLSRGPCAAHVDEYVALLTSLLFEKYEVDSFCQIHFIIISSNYCLSLSPSSPKLRLSSQVSPLGAFLLIPNGNASFPIPRLDSGQAILQNQPPTTKANRQAQAQISKSRHQQPKTTITRILQPQLITDLMFSPIRSQHPSPPPETKTGESGSLGPCDTAKDRTAAVHPCLLYLESRPSARMRCGTVR